MIDKELLLKNVVASFEIEGMQIPLDKQLLMRRYLNGELSEAEFIHENNKRIKDILKTYKHE